LHQFIVKDLKNISSEKLFKIVKFIRDYRISFKFCNNNLTVYQNNRKVNCVDLYANNKNNVEEILKRIFKHYVLIPSEETKKYTPININKYLDKVAKDKETAKENYEDKIDNNQDDLDQDDTDQDDTDQDDTGLDDLDQDDTDQDDTDQDDTDQDDTDQDDTDQDDTGSETNIYNKGNNTLSAFWKISLMNKGLSNDDIENLFTIYNEESLSIQFYYNKEDNLISTNIDEDLSSNEIINETILSIINFVNENK
jgi:hypothetical protein